MRWSVEFTKEFLRMAKPLSKRYRSLMADRSFTRPNL